MLSQVARFVRKMSMRIQRERFRRDLLEEMAVHQEMKYRDHVEAGLEREAAALQTRRDMGNLALAAELCDDVRGFRFLEQLAQDAWYALRLLRRNFGFTLVAVLSLALGIGGSTAVFSILNALLVKPLPFGDPDRLVRITEFFPKALLVHLRQQCGSMDIASVSPGVEMNVTGQGPAYRIAGSAVSANLFSLLHAPVQIGRIFEDYEEQPGRDRVAILSHELWTQRFHSDPSVIGRIVAIDGVQRTIVGVMPAGFSFPSARVQFWFPAALDPRSQFDYWASEFTPLIGRLRPGVSLEQARVELKPAVAEVWRMFPWPMPRGWNANATLVPLQIDLAGDARGRLLILLCAVATLLVIACANVAGLLTARGVARGKEMAMRAALGAGRARIVRQVLTESLVLAGAAGAIGLALGTLAVRLFLAVVPSDLPGATRVGIDWNVAGFAVSLSLLAGISFGIAPALAASRLDILGVVKAGGQRGTTAAAVAFRSWLLAGQIALTLVLVIAASLLVRSLRAQSTTDPGFRPARVLATKISPQSSLCENPSACIALYDRLLREGRATRDVVDVALANTVPFDGTAPALAVDLQDHPKSADFPAPMFWTGAVTVDYLRLMGIPLLAGRPFALSDTRKSEPVVLIDASTARRYWPGQNPIGKHVKWVSETRWRTVVGVVADVRQYNFANRAPSGISGAIYLPYSQAVDAEGRIPAVMNLIVKTAAGRPYAAEELRQLAAAINPDVPVGSAVPLDALMGASSSGARSTTWLFLAFALVALTLAAIGIYGLVSYTVMQRSYDIAVRMAIGATRRSVVGAILARSIRLALCGVSAGVIVALSAARGLSGLLFEVSPTDPRVYACAAAFLVTVVVLASAIPAWRASRIDPVRVLRAE